MADVALTPGQKFAGGLCDLWHLRYHCPCSILGDLSSRVNRAEMMTTTAFSPSARIALLQQTMRTQPQSAALLRELSETLAEAGQEREAADVFRRAYLLEPGICSKAMARVGSDRVSWLRTYSRSLIANGVAYAPVIAALAVAEAHLGNGAEVQRLVDYDRLFSSTIMAPPDGYDQNSFYVALANEIKSDLRFYDAPPNRAIRHAWRRSITGSALPASRAWIRAIRREVERYIAALPQEFRPPVCGFAAVRLRPGRLGRRLRWRKLSRAAHPSARMDERGLLRDPSAGVARCRQPARLA